MITRVATKTRDEDKDQAGRLLRTGEACRMLFVSVNTLRRWNKKGIIGAYRIGSRGDRRFRVEDVNALLTGEIRTNSGIAEE